MVQAETAKPSAPETMAPFTVAHMAEIPSLWMSGKEAPEWKPVRHYLGVRAFGVNAYVARATGDDIVHEHDERAAENTVEQEHEELYFVVRGHATFTVAGETLDAPEGTFVFVRDPGVLRSAVARAADTVVLAVGAQPGVPFAVSPWERRYTGP